MSRIIVILAAVLLMGLLLALFAVTTPKVRAALGFGSGDAMAQCGGGQAGSAIGGPFELVNAAGETVTDADVITRPTLLYFGYTFCPDVCPMDTTRNAEASLILSEQGYDVQPVFISVDPDRDGPREVGEFAENLNAAFEMDRMVGLTGSPEQVAAASKAYRTYYKSHKGENGEDEFYLVDHSTFTYLVLPEQGFVDFFKRETTPDEMARKTACFIDAAS